MSTDLNHVTLLGGAGILQRFLNGSHRVLARQAPLTPSCDNTFSLISGPPELIRKWKASSFTLIAYQKT